MSIYDNIARLREDAALADATGYPAKATLLRHQADELEAKHGKTTPDNLTPPNTLATGMES